MKATHTPPDPDIAESTPADILRGAARYLARYGWTQRDYYPPTDPNRPEDDPTPPACAMGAIGMATYGHRVDSPCFGPLPDRILYRRAVDILRDWLIAATGADPDHGWYISGWNDDPNQTAEQVITALIDAAEAWDHTRLRNTSGGAR